MQQTHGEQIKIVSILLDKYINARMSKVLPNLTPKQTMILLELYDAPHHRLVQKEIENKLRTTHATTRGIIRRLTNSGMVVTSPDPDDRRQIFVSLTADGYQLVNEKRQAIYQVFDEADQKLMKGISQEDQDRFSQILGKIVNNF